MAVFNDELLDLIATTLKDLPKNEVEMMWDSNNFEFSRIYEQSRRKVDGGTSIQRNVILDERGTARYKAMFDSDSPSVQNIHSTIDVPWCQLDNSYSWEILEILRNKNSPRGFIDLIETRRQESLWGMAELIEDRGWKTPNSSTDKLHPFGVPYYLNFANNGVTTAGFIGQTIRFQDGTTSTTCAGLDASVEAKWRNYAGVYTSIDNSFLRTLRRAFLATKFKPPSNVRSMGMDQPGPLAKVYAGLDTVVELQDLADARDDNNTPKDLMGARVVDHEGTTFINQRPLAYVTQLDGASFTPVYFVDWSKFQPIVQDGYWFEESDPMTDRSAHTTATVYFDACHQNLCINRRTAGFVLHTVTS